QIGLFALYNRMRETGGLLLVTGTQAPAQMTLRDDLRTRLGWGL
ncbi:MAG: DnaA regulatory inactivator Hda, partial [Gallionella sp.]|nr:DnaA regulatory inactivator Hda [Gallionella sp.]